MKRYLLFLLFLICCSPAFAQNTTGNIKASGTTCATTNACVGLNLPTNAGGASITISGTWSATLQFEVIGGSGLESDATSVNCFPPNSTTGVSSVTGNGTWTCAVGAMQLIRVRASAYTSGTAVVTIQGSTALVAATIAAGGGGGGTAVNCPTGVAAGTQCITLANSTVTGTTNGLLVSGTTSNCAFAQMCAVVTPLGATGGILGVAVAGGGTTGNVTIAISGNPNCAQDFASGSGTIGGDYLQASSAHTGFCRDVGASYPSSGQVVGRVIATQSGGCGLPGCTIDLFPAEMQAPVGTGINDAFYISSACNANKTNCFQAIDDDSTDNCGTAFTAFMALVNGNTTVQSQLIVEGSGTGKAYRFTACSIPLTNSTKGNIMHIWGSIGCHMALQSCIQVGPTNTSGGACCSYTTAEYTIDGFGELIDGASLTGSGGNGSGTAGGVYVMPQVNTFVIRGIHFAGDGSANGFGTANATLGNCTNWDVYVDTPVAAGDVSYLGASTVNTSNTAGGCGLGNPGGAATGQNTVMFSHNTVGGGGNTALGGSGCGSVGIYDAGSYGSIEGSNNVYGAGVPILLAGIGHYVAGNQLDAAGCVANGVSADIQYGANGSSTAVGPSTVIGNRAQVVSGHATNFIAQAGNSTATLSGWLIRDNLNTAPGGAAGNLFPGGGSATVNCAPNTSTGNICSQANNFGFAPILSTGTTATGWAQDVKYLAYQAAGPQSANVGSTQVIAAPISGNYLVYCKVFESQAATTSSILPACQVTYTDADSGVTATQTITPTNSTNAVGVIQTNSITLHIAAGNNINFQTIGFQSVGGTSMQYTVVATVYAWN